MIHIIYWSGTGNTKKMAECIAEGIKEKQKEVKVSEVSNATNEDILDAELLILGCPAMGAEELDDTEMLPFIETHECLMKDKKMALFGSFGWGSGEWMENWKDQMSYLGAHLVFEPLIINEFTEGQDEIVCKQYGNQLAE